MRSKMKMGMLALSIGLLAGCVTENSQEYEARLSEQNARIQKAIELAEQSQRTSEEVIAQLHYLREATYQSDERAERMLDRVSKK